MKRYAKIFGLSYLITYIVIIVFWILGSPNGCTPGQEIEEGCKIVFPSTFTLLATINIPITLIVGISVIIVLELKKQLRLRNK